MFLTTALFLANRVYGFHPLAAFLFYMLAAAISIGILMAVANARGRSPLWSLFGIWPVLGLLIGLLILIAFPANPEPPSQKAA